MTTDENSDLAATMEEKSAHLVFVLIIVLISTACIPPVFAQERKAPKTWGIALGIRYAAVPFKTEVDSTYDVVPLIFYDHKRFFIKGLTAGFRFYDEDKWQFSAIGRYRFFDIPKEYQNVIREDGVDIGGQLKYRVLPNLDMDLELLTEERGYIHANWWTRLSYDWGRWGFQPYFRLRWKSDDFNNNFYGLDIEKPNNAFDYMIGTDLRYHVWSNLHLIGQARFTLLDDKTRNLEVIDKGTQGSVFFGFGFFNEKDKPREPSLESKPYFRLAHGWATPSSIGNILSGETQSDPYDNQLTSLFLGVPLSDTLFTLPISVYLTPGVVYHHSSEVQNSIFEYLMAVKFYYTVQWPTPWRIGFAEGLSYITEATYIEGDLLERDGYRPSELLNYLDVSLDVSLGHLFNQNALEDLWLGWSIHHRSGIFSTSSAFGRISGGSNYNTVYLQYHF